MGCSNIEESFREIIESDIPTSLKRLGKELDAQWIENALQESGVGTFRRRKLPAALVVWLVIGMALFRDRSIREVVSHLGLVLPTGDRHLFILGTVDAILEFNIRRFWFILAGLGVLIMTILRKN